MTYNTNNKIRKYIRGYGFVSFAKKFGINMVKNFEQRNFSF